MPYRAPLHPKSLSYAIKYFKNSHPHHSNHKIIDDDKQHYFDTMTMARKGAIIIVSFKR